MTRFTRTRRTVLRTAALAVGGLAFEASARGSATGGTDHDSDSAGGSGPDSGDDAGPTARMYASDFHPNARFRVVSEPLEYVPRTRVQEGEAFLSDLYWADHEARIVRYANTGERVLFFPPIDAAVGTGRAYRTGRIRSTTELDPAIVTVGYQPVATGTE